MGKEGEREREWEREREREGEEGEGAWYGVLCGFMNFEGLLTRLDWGVKVIKDFGVCLHWKFEAGIRISLLGFRSRISKDFQKCLFPKEKIAPSMCSSQSTLALAIVPTPLSPPSNTPNKQKSLGSQTPRRKTSASPNNGTVSPPTPPNAKYYGCPPHNQTSHAATSPAPDRHR